VPALPNVPNVLKIELLWTQAGIPCANVLHCSYSGDAPSASDCTSIGGGIAEAFWVVGLYEGYPTSTELVGVRVTDLTTSSSATGEFPVSTSGTYEGGELPAQAAVLVNYQILRRYRGGHPRTYYPPPNQSLLSGPSEWGSTILTELNGQVESLFEYLSTTTVDATELTGQVCVSYMDARVPRVDPLVEPIVGYVVSPIMATQRRRIRASSY